MKHVLVMMVVRKISQVGKMEENRTNQRNIPGLVNVEEIVRPKDEHCWILPEFIKDSKNELRLFQEEKSM